jgi:hypothetical protein
LTEFEAGNNKKISELQKQLSQNLADIARLEDENAFLKKVVV